jgi:hypothetical protein|tara:strand:+ start:639 stop:1010 length:372 start_codon:yes stop_codon:yes gene_type:complete
MSYAQRHAVTLTTIADGSVTGYTPVVTGRISQLRYVKTDFADGVDFTITVEGTGETVWTDTNINASETVAPRQATHDTAGDASLYAAAGEPVEDYIAVADDRIKIVVASGGDTKTGVIHVVLV